ncbi:polysaccharide deacetylase family protein [Candidatus Binatia bacterium]|nr:polysaccharide deacetylase family protein [Candidatus Binatia bacterium]
MPASDQRTTRATTCHAGARVNALSIDVEDWYHDESRGAGPATAAEIAAGGARVERNLERLLALLDAAATHATFFFLAGVAREHPRLARAVAAAGHEIACHGLRHVPVALRSRADVRDDVRRARAILEDVTGARVIGFRAPCFVRDVRHLWLLDELAEAGFAYDSSWLPLRYAPGAAPRIGGTRGPTRLANGLWEFPMPVSRLAGHELPIAAGGFALRALPLAFVTRQIRRFNAEVGPAVVYTHPWEIDPESPKLPGTRGYVRFFNGVGRRSMAQKLARLVRELSFAPLAEVYAAQLAAPPALAAADLSAARSPR